jgi:hypothetical protein
MSDTVKIKITVETGFAGATHTDYDEVDREDWEAMTEDERDEYLDEAAVTLRDNYVYCNAHVIE